MLIQFKVTNFRSLREEQTLSLVASNYDDSLQGNLINPHLPGLSKVKLLKGATIFGANASGKSNIFSALNFMSYFVTSSATKIAPDDDTGTVPFCLDQESKSQPSVFEVISVIEGVRYKYGVSVSRERVHHEILIAYPKGLGQKWFERSYDQKNEKYNWEHSSTNFKLDKDLCDRTRPNSLFLSMGAQFNNDQLTVVYNWFKNGLRFLNLESETQFVPLYSAELVEGGGEVANRILHLLQSADLGITGADVSHEEIAIERFRDNVPPAILRKLEANKKLSAVKTPLIKCLHRTSEIGDQSIDFDEESAGTRRFFSLVGPWLDILESGYTVLIDELETSLHPMLVREFLKLLFSSKYNTNNAQVIFTTHNPLFLESDIMRRDQVWFTEKSENGATHLYPLSDYKPRRNEALMRGYLAGRYGGVPFIPEGLNNQ